MPYKVFACNYASEAGENAKRGSQHMSVYTCVKGHYIRLKHTKLPRIDDRHLA